MNMVVLCQNVHILESWISFCALKMFYQCSFIIYEEDFHYFSKCQNLNVFCHVIRIDLHWVIQVWGKHQLNSTDLKATIVEKYNGVFTKWNGNSVNSGNLINHWSMNWVQFKDPLSHMCLAGTVVSSWSLTQEMTGSNAFTVMSNILVTELSEFNESFRENSNKYVNLFAHNLNRRGCFCRLYSVIGILTILDAGQKPSIDFLNGRKNIWVETFWQNLFYVIIMQWLEHSRVIRHLRKL